MHQAKEITTGKIAVDRAPERLRVSALGSCVAVALYDAKNKVGGVAHIMLPTTDSYRFGDNPLKFADHAIDALIQNISTLHSTPGTLNAILVGGAKIVPDSLDVGIQNIRAIKEKLKKEDIAVVDERLGGIVRRSIFFDLEEGILWCSEDGNTQVPMIFGMSNMDREMDNYESIDT